MKSLESFSGGTNFARSSESPEISVWVTSGDVTSSGIQIGRAHV